MRKREAGQVFLLVLIMLAIGSLMIVPALRLTYTTLESASIIGGRNKGLYAAEATQQIVMWKLYYGDLMEELGFEPGLNTVHFPVDVCGTTANVTVVMRAVEMAGGVILATDHKILPTKTVEPATAASSSSVGPFTYTVALKQVSSNITDGLDVVYDIMSEEFKGKASNLYVAGSSYISTDNISWQQIGDPKTNYSSNSLLRWPATGDFTAPFRDFYPGQTKYLKFDLSGPFNHDDIVVCNWVVVKTGDIFSLSTPQASLSVGNPPDPDECEDSGLFTVDKVSDPTVIPPDQPTEVTYTVTVTNMAGSTNRIIQIDDYLPPGFVYMTEYDPTGDITVMPPYSEYATLNGVERQHLWWQAGGEEGDQLLANGVTIAAGASMTLTFVALAEQGISGNYYNEVVVIPATAPPPGPFDDLEDEGFDQADYGESYSWSTGVVTVPAYDSQAQSEGETVDASMSVQPDTVTILSWSAR
ncbi:hypothetical protein ACFLXO_03150 [Chloroflexota bacterium]